MKWVWLTYSSSRCRWARGPRLHGSGDLFHPWRGIRGSVVPLKLGYFSAPTLVSSIWITPQWIYICSTNCPRAWTKPCVASPRARSRLSLSRYQISLSVCSLSNVHSFWIVGICSGHANMFIPQGTRYTYGSNPPEEFNLPANATLNFTIFLKDFDKVCCCFF